MKKIAFVAFFFLLVGGLNNSFAQAFHGADGQIALQTEDAEIVEQGNSVVLAGGSGSASVFFLFEADRSAIGFNIIVDYHGDGWVEIIDVLLSTNEKPRPYIIPINGKDDNDGKRIINFSDPINRVLDQDGNVEVHIRVGPGQCIILNSIVVEYIYQGSRVEIQKEIRVVNRYYGILPPGYTYPILNYYHRGPIWVWNGYGYAVYDGWWYSPVFTEWLRVYYPTPTYRYYYHYCGNPYVREKYIYYHSGSSGSKIYDRQDFTPNRKAPEKVRSVIGNIRTKRDFQTQTGSQKLQNSVQANSVKDVQNKRPQSSAKFAPSEKQRRALTESSTGKTSGSSSGNGIFNRIGEER
ncbi:MAG: hypothetical protein PHE77_01635 [Candidatus Pacebacteria bacterium]|nr:hypothetical protein [Candidatus Paceibacterota bacterium]